MQVDGTKNLETRTSQSLDRIFLP